MKEKLRSHITKEYICRLVILLVGLTIAHFGVTLFLLADLGSDPFNVLIQGLYRSVSNVVNLPFLTHGRIHMIVCLLIIVILLFTDRSYVKAGTIVCMFFGGPIIDVFTLLLGPFFAQELSLPVLIVFNALGCAILAYGMTIVIKSDAGTGPNDLVAIVISDKCHFPFSIVRVAVDILFAGAGFLLGGTVGLGTVICAFVVGPVAGVFLPVNGRLVEHIVQKFCPSSEKGE